MRNFHSSLDAPDLAEDSSVNLTPLIDVVFVVLIMFILVAPLVQLDKVELATGGEEALSLGKDSALIGIHVYADNSIQLNGKPMTLSSLADALRVLRAQHPSTRAVRLFHDVNARFGTYQSIKNQVEATGFEAMDVVLKTGP